MSGFWRLDLGLSYMYWPTPVTTILFNRAARTLILFLSGAVLAYILGIWLGKMVAWHRGSLFEYGATLGGVAAYTSFAPWLGFLALNVFGWYLGWLPYQRLVNHNVWFNAPVTIEWMLGRLVITGVLASAFVALAVQVSGYVKLRWARWGLRLLALSLVGVGVWLGWRNTGLVHLAKDLLLHLILPLGTVISISFGETMMLMRTTMLETISEDYVLTARAKGLSSKQIRDQHVARNAILPVLTRMLLNLPFVLIGSLAIELVFQWHAMGKVIFDAIEVQDMPVLMGVLSLVGVFTLLAHIVLDIVHVYLDPRLRVIGKV
jgi:peptide/nickel transport system permease protein